MCEVTAWLGLWRTTLLTKKRPSPYSFNPSVMMGFKFQLLAPEKRDFQVAVPFSIFTTNTASSPAVCEE